MFVLYEPDQRIPIKVWLADRSDLDPACLEQATHLAMLPFAHSHVALMPDCHSGYGMPIGGILATRGVVVPNAVGVDIGCGMAFLQTNIPAALLREATTPSGTLLQAIVGAVLRSIPVGFAHHSDPQPCSVLDRALDSADGFRGRLVEGPDELVAEIEAGYYQVGTLGGGNHFIELQEDENGLVAIMLHSGSRNFGYKICRYFNRRAQELNKQWYSSVPPEWDLAFLPVDTKEGQQYLAWMLLAQDFARENRERIMFKVQEVLFNMVRKYAGFAGIEETMSVNCHHNYCTLEHHFGQNLWVHRKGAIRVRHGELGLIPGAMGSPSYVVRGLGNPESFCSCSHGAGRSGSRRQAMKTYSVQSVLEDLRAQGIVLGKHNKTDVAEECRWAYKDIEQVMAQQGDLVEVVKRLKTIAVVKG